jgi:tetratricopeptide (TPR) repeat protein
LVVFRALGDRRGESAALGNLGLVHAVLGDARKAIECYEQELAITRARGDRGGEGNALYRTALVLDKLGQRDNAIQLAGQALPFYEAIESPWAKGAVGDSGGHLSFACQ